MAASRRASGRRMTERVSTTTQGQLLTASFMDYAMPRADDLPFFGFTTEPVPSTGNPLGMKGCGEAGTVGALAAHRQRGARCAGPARRQPRRHALHPRRGSGPGCRRPRLLPR